MHLFSFPGKRLRDDVRFEGRCPNAVMRAVCSHYSHFKPNGWLVHLTLVPGRANGAGFNTGNDNYGISYGVSCNEVEEGSA